MPLRCRDVMSIVGPCRTLDPLSAPSMSSLVHRHSPLLKPHVMQHHAPLSTAPRPLRSYDSKRPKGWSLCRLMLAPFTPELIVTGRLADDASSLSSREMTSEGVSVSAILDRYFRGGVQELWCLQLDPEFVQPLRRLPGTSTSGWHTR